MGLSKERAIVPLQWAETPVRCKEKNSPPFTVEPNQNLSLISRYPNKCGWDDKGADAAEKSSDRGENLTSALSQSSTVGSYV